MPGGPKMRGRGGLFRGSSQSTSDNPVARCGHGERGGRWGMLNFGSRRNTIDTSIRDLYLSNNLISYFICKSDLGSLG